LRTDPLLVVVTGPPAAGKTAIAASLRDSLGLPLIAKDTLKEVLGSALDVTGRAESKRLGGAVFQVLAVVVHELLAHGVSTIAEGNFAAGAPLFVDLPPAWVVQVHVSAPPHVVRARLLERDPHRHAVHYDREAADEIAARARAGEWEPLPLGGELVRVDTETWPDLDELADRVASVIAEG
jgi:dephospho-CoA kinase